MNRKNLEIATQQTISGDSCIAGDEVVVKKALNRRHMKP